MLREEIKKAGSITAWCERMGQERSYLSSVLHKRKLPSKKILASLNLSEVLVWACDAARNRRRQNKMPGKGRPHARW
jgi:hypothetical protein